MPSFWDTLFGTKDKKVSTLDPTQQKMFQDYAKGIQSNPLYQQGTSYIQKLLSGDTSAFEAPLMQQYEQQVVPAIAERFAGMGTGAGAGNSSALYNTLAQSGQDLIGQLGALRGGLQMQGLGQALNYAQQPYSNMLGGLGLNTQAIQKGSPGLLQGILPSILGGAASGLGFGAAGPLMSVLGNIFGAGNAPAVGDSFQTNNPWSR